MKINISSILVLGLATQVTVASTWFGKTIYNKWHETELERWLSDHDIPYPTPADRKDLENLVKSNWDSKVQTPVSQASDQSADTYNSVKDWIFDSWTDSQLKLFLDKHSIPSPQPRKRDTLLKAVRENYESAAKTVGETVQYPGNWLYESWSESDLKEYLDERGFSVPQPSTRDKLIASVRRNSYLASQNMNKMAAEASSSANAAKESLSDALLDAWSDSQIKEWADKNGIKVPQGSKRNELLALARKHRVYLYSDNIASSASSAYGAATSMAGNEYAKATDDAQLKYQDTFDSIADTWSDSRLKAFLDARGVPVPQSGKRDEILARVRLNKHKVATGFNAWTFDTWTTENLKKWLATQNDKSAEKAGTTRDELVKQAQNAYASASKAGGSSYASVTSYLAAATDTVKDTTFDTWSESELKSYLDSYGIPTYQGSTMNELKAAAKRNANYFRYGTTTPSETIFAKIQSSFGWLVDQVKMGASSGKQEAMYQGQKATDAATEKGSEAAHRASEAAQKASDRVKEEL
ncbi:MAG: hypothetical protein M1834_000614 [Cirrosporium novae-zelandiae]|nr:MAG: hypothetical protein M1834_000614 [Cirrosporium novae-zelandiae]